MFVLRTEGPIKFVLNVIGFLVYFYIKHKTIDTPKMVNIFILNVSTLHLSESSSEECHLF